MSSADLANLLNETARFACDINATMPYWLTLIGEAGIGKTHLARAVYKSFIDITRFDIKLDAQHQHIYGNRGQFCDWRKLCAVVREGAFGWVEDLCEDDFVVLDDIGAEYDRSGFIASVLDRIMNSRRGKWTLITCNLTLQQISERMDVRIASRLMRDSNRVVESGAMDFALARGKNDDQ